MSEPWADWETLNAYVDGELAPDERAEVAARLAGRPDLARQVAALTKMKAALAAGVEAPAWDEVAPESSRGWRAFPWWRIAAVLVIAVGLGATAVLMPRGKSGQPAWLAAPVAAHDAWVKLGAPELPGSGAGSLLVGLATLGTSAELPDLSATKLTITGARFVPARDGNPPAMHVAYSGTRGCRVTLWITPPPDNMEPALTLRRFEKYRAYTWRAGDLGYALVSAIDPERFEVIAHAARKVTIERAQPDLETATALRKSRERSPPCHA